MHRQPREQQPQTEREDDGQQAAPLHQPGIDQGVDSIVARLGKLENRVDSIDERLGNLEARADSVDARLDRLGARADSVDARLGGLEGRVEHHWTDMQEVWREIAGNITTLRKGQERIEGAL